MRSAAVAMLQQQRKPAMDTAALGRKHCLQSLIDPGCLLSGCALQVNLTLTSVASLQHSGVPPLCSSAGEVPGGQGGRCSVPSYSTSVST
jgi:hypothetical protein